jgi:hypothetical protein
MSLGFDIRDDDDWNTGLVLSMKDLVSDFEGTDLAHVFPPARDAARQVRLAKIVSRRANLHMIELNGPVAGPSGLTWQSTDFARAPMSAPVMLSSAMLEELIRIAKADRLGTVSCCEKHVRPTTGKDVIASSARRNRSRFETPDSDLFKHTDEGRLRAVLRANYGVDLLSTSMRDLCESPSEVTTVAIFLRDLYEQPSEHITLRKGNDTTESSFC